MECIFTFGMLFVCVKNDVYEDVFAVCIFAGD